jgi:hypothetical protein
LAWSFPLSVTTRILMLLFTVARDNTGSLEARTVQPRWGRVVFQPPTPLALQSQPTMPVRYQVGCRSATRWRNGARPRNNSLSGSIPHSRWAWNLMGLLLNKNSLPRLELFSLSEHTSLSYCITMSSSAASQRHLQRQRPRVVVPVQEPIRRRDTRRPSRSARTCISSIFLWEPKGEPMGIWKLFVSEPNWEERDKKLGTQHD